MNPLAYSKQDSLRFGLRIFRSESQEIDAEALTEQIIGNKIDVAILRIPSTELAQLEKVEKTAMPFFVADSLVYYEADLENLEKKEYINENLEVTAAGLDDHEQLDDLVAECFGDYKNHYRMNLYFDNKHVTEGYQDWVRSYAEGNKNRVCWLFKVDGELAGFTNFNLADTAMAKGVLYGVKKEFRSKGVFRDMIRYAINYAKDNGFEKLQATMQLENIAVQKVWTQEGLIMNHALNTIHINSMLTKSVFDPFKERIVISKEEMNSQKVSNRHILRKINWFIDFKQNVVTQNHRFINLLPLKPEVDYDLKFTYPTASKGMLRVLDEEKRPHFLVYFDIKHSIG